jgi:coniferyl-aldehyde dehydrogenase
LRVLEIFTTDEVVVVHGDQALSAAFTRLPFDHLLFTGSTAVGRLVMAAAANNLTPVTLELGGKCPAVIAPGYPIEHAADRIAFGKCFNGGKTCVAPDYVLVPRAQRDAFVAAYMASLKRRYPTLADNPDYTVTINARQATRLRDWLADAQQRGVQIVQPCWRRTVPVGIELIPPTILPIRPAGDGMREEIRPAAAVCASTAMTRRSPGCSTRRRWRFTFDNDHERRSHADRISAGMCVNGVLSSSAKRFRLRRRRQRRVSCYHGRQFPSCKPQSYASRA